MGVHGCNKATTDDESRAVGAIPGVVGRSDVEDLDGKQSEHQTDSTSHSGDSGTGFVVIVRFRRVCN